jgi:2-polyprenyl-6-methoxyphenol hydroxylase-like FAD-dependent oxidoreductase
MNEPSIMNPNQINGVTKGHAVVIGSSIAGLTAARVLTDHFARVTLIDRDRLPDTPEFRRGVPQAGHAHTLPLRGQTMLEQQFPGLVEELLANGAIPIKASSELAFFLAGKWHVLPHHADVVSLTYSRPLLESTIYRRLAAQPNVDILQEHEALGLSVDEQGERVTGVRLRHRRGLSLDEIRLAADVVVDASGRESRAPQWLASLGYPPPPEARVNSFPGYATRLYRRPAGFNDTWKTLYIRPTPPNGRRGGLVIPIEGDRWQVTLIGMARDYPPTAEEGFLAFARSLPTQRLYEAIKEAKPLTKPYGYRHTENRLRRYDKLERYLEGFLVCGDAVCALNPVYALGMTVVAMGSQALDHCLTEQRRQSPGHDLKGLAEAFQKQLSQVVAGSWQMAIEQDSRWPLTQATTGTFPTQARVSGLGFSPKSAPARAGRVVIETGSRL